jgi:hypothetical protein
MRVSQRRLLRRWSVFAAVPASAVAGDALTEFLSNAGLLGGPSPSDLQHQALAPVALLAVITILSVALVALCVRARDSEPVAYRRTLGETLLVTSTTLLATFAAVVMMEGYETRFGGTAPFDAHSVMLSHAPAVLLCYAVVTALVRNLVSVCLHVAIAAGRLAAAAILQILEFDRRLPRTRFASAFACGPAIARHTSPIRHVHGFRAPPRSPLTSATSP